MVEATEWSTDDVQYLLAHYWDDTYSEIAEELGMSQSVVCRKAKNDLELPKKTEKNRIEYRHGVGIGRVLYHLHHDALMSEAKMAEALDVSRMTLTRYFQNTGVTKRGRSEAERVKRSKMSEEELRELTEAARDEAREKYGDGGYLAQWVSENPDDHAEVAQEAAALGAPAREKNGMAGMTGQDNPNWRGGKSVYDAVKKQLRPSWWTVRDEARADKCYRCGASDCKLDVHHLIPIMVGGTNDPWNLMTLCESCHKRAEEYVRQYAEFDPVLVE